MIKHILLQYDSVTLVACNEKGYDYVTKLNALGVHVQAIDYDPKFELYKDNMFKHLRRAYQVNDIIFDTVEIKGEVIAHFNCEKTYPIGRIYKMDMVLIGDNKQHNGDCNPISSCQQLIDQNELTKVYDQFEENGHYVVYGSNIS